MQVVVPFGQGVAEPSAFSFVDIEELDKRLQEWVERENEQTRADAATIAELSKVDTEAHEIETAFDDFLDNYLKNDKPTTSFILDWNTYYKTNFE